MKKTNLVLTIVATFVTSLSTWAAGPQCSDVFTDNSGQELILNMLQTKHTVHRDRLTQLTHNLETSTTNQARNENTIDIAKTLNAMVDLAVQDLYVQKKFNAPETMTIKEGAAVMMDAHIEAIAQMSNLAVPEIQKIIVQKIKAAAAVPPTKKSAGFIANESNLDPNTINYRIGFSAQLEPASQNAYGREVIPEPTQNLNVKNPMGFIWSNKDGNATGANNRTIGFIPQKFVDDSFVYKIELNPITGDFVLVK